MIDSKSTGCHISAKSHFQSCAQSNGVAFSYESEIWGYVIGDGIHLERSRSSQCGPYDGFQACVIRSMIIDNKSKNLGELLKVSMEAEMVIKDLNNKKSSRK